MQRQRVLLVLGGVTVLFAALAAYAVMQQAREVAPKFTARPLFPGLAAQLNNLGEVGITTQAASFHVRLVDGKWVIVERGNFPADFATVRRTGIGIADLELLEPKTARPELHELLGLRAPAQGGNATRITLNDRAGKPLADVLVSGLAVGSEPDGRSRLYVRKTAENQAWLAHASLAVAGDIADWIEKKPLTIERARIAGATVTPATGPAYTISRASKEEADFRIENMPRGRELSFPGAANPVAAALTDFTFEDVQDPKNVDFARAATHVTRTFDGLTITTRIVMKDAAQWAQLTAQSTRPETQMEADDINARLGSWALKLPGYAADTLLAARDSLLKAPEAAAPAAPAATAPAPTTP
jgi:hypothetical protein